MFDTIILLASDLDEPVLTKLLRNHHPGLAIRRVETAAGVAALKPQLLRRARLIGFLTPVIVPPTVLNRLGHGAYNFHPGPPNYPGWAPALFAIHDDARQFGVTVHRMERRVDEGAIVAAELYPIPANATVCDLEALSYVGLLEMFRQMAFALAIVPEPLPALPMKWTGAKCSRRAFAAIRGLPADSSTDDIVAEAMRWLDCTASDFGHLQSRMPAGERFAGAIKRSVPQVLAELA